MDVFLYDAQNRTGFQVLQGRYSVWLLAAINGPDNIIPAGIGQVCVVPGQANSLWFSGSGSFTVSFAGQPVAGFAGLGNAYDISPFAGQSGELRIEGGGLIDSIYFSSTYVGVPQLRILQTNGAVMVTWKYRSDGWNLQQAPSLTAGWNWTLVPPSLYQTNGNDISFAVPIDTANSAFYRLGN